MKKVIFLALGLIASANVQAYSYNQGTQATINSQDQTISLTINNKSHEWLSSFSYLVPAQARTVAPFSSAIFKINQPQAGIQKIHYEETEGFGCDFYLDTEDLSITDQPSLVTFVVPIPISSGSICQVHTSNFANHLTYERLIN